MARSSRGESKLEPRNKCVDTFLLSISYSHLSAVQKLVTISHSAISACLHADAVVIVTEWAEFRNIDWKEVYKSMNKPAFIFDGRLVLGNIEREQLGSIGFKVRSECPGVELCASRLPKHQIQVISIGRGDSL